ncbi:response regulator [Algiphilus sp. W345]|uniref:Response regulator n=1 Tax=Banduia mediterranea TaxID=3075609 RepID=A0ABU2WI50_9GAMM|nr:response regulator [Algiphilus sp. W345]MDT0497550.1 response regulator [Algiphilus sp. W345]
METDLRNRRVLVVDDDDRLRALIVRHLNDAGMDARGVPDARQMQRWLEREHQDLIVLDLMLPDDDGLRVCSRLRAEGNDVPVLMLTAKGDDVDRILGLEVGADDYLPKPCNARELVARVKAILRRTRSTPPGAPEPQLGQYRFGPFILDFERRSLTRDADTRIPLTTGDFALLSALIRHAGQPLSRDRLYVLATGREYLPEDRAIDVRVSRLRKLLTDDNSQPRYIQTVWGFGYVFVADG